jgi:hypothetical protein
MSKKLVLSLYKDTLKLGKLLDKEIKRLRIHKINELSICKTNLFFMKKKSDLTSMKWSNDFKGIKDYIQINNKKKKITVNTILFL